MSLLSDAESDSEFQLTINDHYAKAFQYKKEREELEKLKLKYGSDAEEEESETDSESDESEDEDGEELTPAVDAAILRTLARIKRKDPEIYNSETGIFEEEHKKLGLAKPIPKHKQPKDKSKPITMKQVALEAQLQSDSRSPSPELLTHTEEQRRLRNETIAAFNQVGEDNGDNDLFVLREKTKNEQKREEEEYRSFLEREVGGDLRTLVTVEENPWKGVPASTSSTEEKKKKKKKKASVNVEEDAQEFLMNYILNRGWMDRSAHRVPTYREVVSKNKGKSKAEQEEDEEEDANRVDEEIVFPTANLEVDEDEFEEIVDRFESSYNFRFEEPDAAVIQIHPRNIPSLVRREDSKRKPVRERRKQRKEEEIQKKREEVKRLKALKMKELRAKLDQIGKQGGKNYEDDPALHELDLEGDWDPDAHDRQMEGLYAEDGDYDETDKPTWDDDIDIGDIAYEIEPELENKQKKKKKTRDDANNDGVDVNAMDADVEKADDDEEWDGTEEMRKRKVEEYMDEVYGLDFNDMVGGMPTRFHYAHVEPQSYQLTPAEVLMATDAELNEYMGIKKFAPYRRDGKWDPKRGDRLKDFKQKIRERGLGGDAAQDEKLTKKRKGKKERMKMKTAVDLNLGGDDGPGEAAVIASLKRKRPGDGEVQDKEPQDNGPAEKKRRRRHKNKARSDADA